MNKIEKCHLILYRAESLLVNIAAASLFGIMLIVVFDVVMRYGLNAPLSWSYELISMYLMVVLFFFALSHTLADDGHICVDILHIRISARSRHFCLAAGYWLSAVLFSIILWISAERTWVSYIQQDVTAGEIAWPMWLSQLCVPVGVGLLLARILLRAVGHTLSGLQDRPIVPLPLVSGHETE